MSDQQRDEPNDVVDGVVIRRPEWARPAPPPKPAPAAEAAAAEAKAAEPDSVEIEHLPSPSAVTRRISKVSSSRREPEAVRDAVPELVPDTIVTTPSRPSVDAPRRWLHLPRAGAAAAAVAITLLGGAAWVLAGNGDDATPARGSAAGRADLPLVVLGDPSLPEGSSASSAGSPSADSSSTAAGFAPDTGSSATSRGSTVSRGQQRRDLATTGATRAKGPTTTRPDTSSSTSASSTSSSSSPSTGQSSSPSSPSDSPSPSPSEPEPGDDDHGKGKGKGTGSPSPTETTSPTTSPTAEPDCVLILCR